MDSKTQNQTPVQNLSGDSFVNNPSVNLTPSASSQASSLPNYQSPNLTPPPNQEIINEGPESQKKPSFILPLVLSLIFLLVITLFGAGSAAVAYNKIKLPDKYQKIELGVTNFVQSLPFTPKTPEFLIAKALMAQDTINKEAFDISVALDSKNGSLIPGMDSKIDLSAKGKVDYSDTKNVKFTVDAFLTKDFNIELLKSDQILYFKISKVPSLLLSFIGMKSEDFDPILNTWYYYDTAPLDTEARKQIDDKQDREVFSDKFVKDSLDTYVDEKLLSAMKVENDTVDEIPVYKISITADTELIDHIGKLIDEEESKDRGASLDTYYQAPEKLSDIVKSMTWEVDIDKKEYYVRKVAITAEVEVDEVDGLSSLFIGISGLPLSGTSTNIAVAAKFSDFGKDVVVEKPEVAKSWEEFTNEISDLFQKQYSSYYNAVPSSAAKAKDAKRMNDLMMLQSAVELYREDCGKYPANLNDMTHSAGSENCPGQKLPSGIYIATVPKDPTGEDYYYKLSASGIKFDLCAKLEVAENITNDTCPNPNYNYHLTAP